MQGRVLGGRYRLVSPLGQGGMGSVWRAEQLDLPKQVAIKLINPNQAGSAEIRVRFEREARAAAQLASLHIVDITDYGIDNDTPYIVMKLLEGESLAKRLERQRRLSFEETVRVLSQVARALTLAHEKRIVHRDLKPENVFIEGYVPNGEADQGDTELVKVLDFGVAKMLDSQSFGSNVRTRAESLLGTPFYMSPEQINDSSNVDHRADIWSFGVMAYECVTGKRPFEANSLALLWDGIRSHATRPPSEVVAVSSGFDEWFAQATACDVEERFGTVKEAMAALRAIRDTRAEGAAVAVPSARDAKPSVPVTTEVVSPPAGLPAPEVRPIEPAAAKKVDQSAVTPNTVEPSSVTFPGLLKRASRRTLAVALLVLGGIVGMAAYLTRSSSVADPASSGTTSVNAVPATPSVSTEVAPPSGIAPPPVQAVSAVPTVSVVPFKPEVDQVKPAVEPSKPPGPRPPSPKPHAFNPNF